GRVLIKASAEPWGCRFTSKSGHSRRDCRCPLSAISGHSPPTSQERCTDVPCLALVSRADMSPSSKGGPCYVSKSYPAWLIASDSSWFPGYAINLGFGAGGRHHRVRRRESQERARRCG